MSRKNRVVLDAAARMVRSAHDRVSFVHAAHDYRRANIVVALDHLEKAKAALLVAAAEE